MSFGNQKTIACEGRISGIGLHTGEVSEVFFRPAAVDSGIRFMREGRWVGPLSEESDGADTLRCSSVGEGENRILTVEHLLASLSGLGITNLDIDVHGREIPGLDGSALKFVEYLKEVGIVDQPKPAPFYRIQEPVFCYDNERAIAIYPADHFSVAYLLDYDHPYLRRQKVDFMLSPQVFEKEIAPARTFCTESEAQDLRLHGLGLGANRENTLVVTPDGSHAGGQRFPDECARHKVLDILGDLALLGFPVQGRVVGIRSGHTLNRRLIQAIKNEKGDHGHKKTG